VDFNVLACLEFGKQRPVAGKAEPKLGFIAEKVSLLSIAYSLFYLGSSSWSAQVQLEPCLMVMKKAIMDKGVCELREAGPRLILDSCWLIDSCLFAHGL
jgi:hypothetical protein